MTTASIRLYRVSLRMLPSHFRDTYSAEMEEVFVQRLSELRGIAGFALTVSESVDVGRSALRLRFGHVQPAMIGAVTTLFIVAALSFRSVGGSISPLTIAAVDSIDFRATDPAGEFTIAIRNGRPVSATIDRVTLPSSRLVHLGDSIRLLGPQGQVVLAVAYYHDRARIEWQPRDRSCRGKAIDCAL
jgi:hypothetical protein